MSYIVTESRRLRRGLLPVLVTGFPCPFKRAFRSLTQCGAKTQVFCSVDTHLAWGQLRMLRASFMVSFAGKLQALQVEGSCAHE
jgi:hypothetical protein